MVQGFHQFHLHPKLFQGFFGIGALRIKACLDVGLPHAFHCAEPTLSSNDTIGRLSHPKKIS